MLSPGAALGAALLLAACGTGDGSADAPDAAGAAGGDEAGTGDATASVTDAGTSTDAAPHDAGPIDWTVNGHLLTPGEQAPVLVIAADVVPRLAGTREDRLLFAARGAWWALKEGTWEQSLPAIYGYSNCNSASGDHVIGPTEICGTGRAWQVGLAAVQVPGHTVTELEARVPVLFPGMTADALLADVAMKAGEDQATSDAIVMSTGSLRASWLLRVPAIGFDALVPGEVVPECIDGTKSWCFGTAWPETKKFAPTQAAALVSIGDLHRILSSLAP
ncbi:MAG: hypothetical protein QOI41_850 [Myxococcales bacterium]|nr:hypothetical protein [Myxococcales bacterium]